MLVQQQPLLNGHPFARRIAQRFIHEEWVLGNPAALAWRRTGDTAAVRVESDPVVRNERRAESDSRLGNVNGVGCADY